MELTVLAQQILNGVILGSIYAMIAVGLAMIYGVLKVLHVAHAGVYAAGAYLGLLFYTISGSLLLAFVGGMLAAGLLGAAIERFVYRPMLERPRIVALIASIGLYIFLADMFRILAGPYEIPFQVPLQSINLTVGGLYSSAVDWIIIGGTAIIFAIFWFIMQKTKLGFGIRAVAEDPEAARMMGVNSDHAVMAVFFLGSAIAAYGGVTMGILYNAVYPTMGDVFAYKGLALIVIGGFGSIPGAILAAFILGLSETFLKTYTQVPLSREGIGMLLLIILILVRPRGLLGRA